MDPGVLVLGAGFQQEHFVATVFGQPVGQDRTGAPGADDDVVESRMIGHSWTLTFYEAGGSRQKQILDLGQFRDQLLLVQIAQ